MGPSRAKALDYDRTGEEERSPEWQFRGGAGSAVSVDSVMRACGRRSTTDGGIGKLADLKRFSPEFCSQARANLSRCTRGSSEPSCRDSRCNFCLNPAKNRRSKAVRSTCVSAIVHNVQVRADQPGHARIVRNFEHGSAHFVKRSELTALLVRVRHHRGEFVIRKPATTIRDDAPGEKCRTRHSWNVSLI
jgi:hypothetical protein